MHWDLLYVSTIEEVLALALVLVLVLALVEIILDRERCPVHYRLLVLSDTQNHCFSRPPFLKYIMTNDST